MKRFITWMVVAVVFVVASGVAGMYNSSLWFLLCVVLIGLFIGNRIFVAWDTRNVTVR